MPQKKTINYDYFNEDDVEQEILCTKPISFLLYGKPHSERKKLAKLIAENWNCVHVDVTSLCEEVIDEKKFPPEILHNLYEGKTVGDPELMKEVCKKLRSNVIAHRGYILTGLPTVDHCNVAIFKSQLEILKSVYPQPDFIIYLKMDNEDVYETMINKKFDPQTGIIHLLEPEHIEKVDAMSKRRARSRPRLSTSVNSSIMAFSEMYEETEETENVSEIIIPQLTNYKASQKSRPSVSVEAMSRLITPPEFMPSKAKSMLECYHNMLEPIFYNEYLAHCNKLNVFELNALKSAQVLLTEVLDRLKCFHCSPAYLAMPFYVNLRELEERKKAEKKLKNTPENKKMKWGVSKSSVFEQSPINLPSHVGAAKVESFVPLSNAESGEEEETSTRPLSEGSAEEMISENESEEFQENEQSDKKDEVEIKHSDKILGIIPDSQLTEEEFFRMMANTLTIDPKWKWRKSKWFHYCPVALTKGFITPGLVEYSVRYLDKIYALSSLEALKTFVENPRPFLKAPKPKNHCKVVVTGFPYSGKTTASQALAKVYGARVIDVNDIAKPAIDAMKAKYREEVLRIVIKDLVDKMTEKAAKQQEKLQSSILKQAESMNVMHVEQDTTKLKKEVEVGEEEKEEEEEDEEVKEDEEQEEQMEEEDGNGSPDFLIEPGLEDSNMNLINVEEEEEEDVDGMFIAEDDPDVVEAVEERMKNYSPELSPNELIVLLEEAVIKLQKELTCERKEPVLDGGWVIDNFPLRLRHWDALMKSSSLTRPTTIFCLIDESAKKEIVISRWYNANRREINQKIIARLQDSITQELVEERKNELGNLLDDLEAGELIESEQTSKRTLSRKEEGSQIEYDIKEDERAEILSRYVPSLGKESQVEKLSGMSRNLPVRVAAPRLEDDNEWIKSDRSIAASQDYYQGEKKPSIVDVNIIDDDSDDELVQKKTRSNTNRNNYQGRELNRSNNRTQSDGLKRKTYKILDERNISLGQSDKLKGRHPSSRKTLTRSRQTGKGDILTSLGLAYDPENESFINNLNKFAVFKSDSMDQGGFPSITPSKTNIMDNLRTDISDDVSEKLSEDSDLIQVTCLIQSLLGVLWYLPLDGPEKSKMEDDLQLVVDRLKVIMESLKSYKVLLKKIVIGTQLEVPRVIYKKTPRKMSKKSTKHDLRDEETQNEEVVSPTSDESPEEDEDEEETDVGEMEIPMLDETSAKSEASEGVPKLTEDEVDEEVAEEEQSQENAIEDIQDFPDLEHLDLSFHQLKYFSSFLGNIGNLLSQGWDPKDSFAILDEITEHLEELFRHKAVEGAEVDEGEEEEVEEEEEDQEEIEEREKMESKEKSTELQKAYKKFNFGDTSYFCPVALKEDMVLHPGSPDITATYRDKIYFFMSEEAQQKFLKMPHHYVAGKLPLQTPPLRLLIMGPPGSGKSTLSRHLVNKLDICHIQFKKYLQEMIIARTKRMILRDDDREEEDIEDFSMLEKEEIKDRLRAMGKMNWENKKEDFLTSGLSSSLLQVSSMTKYPSLEKARVQEFSEPPVLTEKEQAIADYLTSVTFNPSQANLPRNILEEILKEFWNGETFSKSGFILEDFPNNETELRQMVEFGLYPDAILVLETDVSESLKRMLPNLMKKWKEKVQKKKSFEFSMAEAYKTIKKEAMEARKKELLALKNKVSETLKGRKKRFSSSLKGVRFISEDEMTEMMDIMEKFLLDFDMAQILANEFEEEDQMEEEEDEEEKEGEAEERIKQSFVQLYDNMMDTLARLIETQQELRIPTMSVNSSKRFPATTYSLNQHLEPFLTKRRSLFEKVIPVPMHLAEEMIKSGYKTLSRFNRWCPVKALDGNPTCDFPGGPSYAAVHRSFVYFLSSKSNLAKFMHDPLYYLCNSPSKVCIPIRCAIMGPPKSGKTTIANRLKAEYGVRRISPGDAIRKLISDFPRSHLVKRILVMLYSGHALSSDLTSKAISKILMDTDCNTNGYILDGCPVSKEIMESLEAQSIIPYRVIYLKISLEQLEKQAAGVKFEPSEFPHLDILRTFPFQLEAYNTHEPSILAWYGEQRNNLLEVPMERSKWWVWIRVIGDINYGIQSVREYYEGMSRDGVASLAGMGITPAELKQKLGHFEEFCPVSFVDKDELVDLSQSKTIEYAAEFNGTYYRLAGKAELAKFLKNHMFYVSKFGLPPPQCRPIRKSKEEASKAFGAKIGLLGFCPVTYFEGDQLYNSLVRGNPELAVQYLDTIYYFTSEENLFKFMRSPKKYHNLKTPTIIPPDLPPLKYTSLPIPGYLEQSVSQDVIKALTAVGNFKPKYPFLSPQESAVTYVALYLKAHNLKSSVFTRKRFHRKLKEFEDRCDLIKYLNSNMSRAYKEESDRPSGFDSKLEEFFRLERSSANEKRKISFL